MSKIGGKAVNKQLKIDIRGIQLIVYDFDGVFTDNKVLVFENGKEAIFCNRADGLAVQKIKKLGIPQIILSTEKDLVVKVRAKKLDINVIHNISDKRSILISYCKEKNYDLKKVLYIGNDINDLEVMKTVGYPIAPQDAHKEIKKIAKIVTIRKGGEGVVREILDYCLFES